MNAVLTRSINLARWFSASISPTFEAANSARNCSTTPCLLESLGLRCFGFADREKFGKVLPRPTNRRHGSPFRPIVALVEL